MNLLPMLLPLAAAKLKEMTTEEKTNLLWMIRQCCDVLLSGDNDQIEGLLAQFEAPTKVKDLIRTEFAHENRGE